MAKKKPAPKQLPEISFFVTCDAVSRDPNSGKLSLYGVFDKFNTAKFPAVFSPFALVARLKGGSGDHTIGIDILDPSGKKATGEKDLTLEVHLSPSSAIEIVTQVIGFTVLKAGICKFVLKSGNRRIGKPLEVPVARRKKKS